ncbi:MAG: SIR2 family protein [Myxococcota bacterium]
MDHKKGLPQERADQLLVNAAQGPGWALCIGAGTSLPIFPDWNRLVRNLIARIHPDRADELAKTLSAGFAPDSLIQAASILNEGGPERFAALLTDELYRDFLDHFGEAERQLVVTALAATRPGDLSSKKWTQFSDLLTKHWGDAMSCLAIAPVISRVLGTSLSPSSILSFNAEPLLFAAINAHQASADPAAPQRIDRVVRGISNRNVGRVPYVFCHGLLPVPDTHASPLSSSPDTLVFSESAYLQLAANLYSWQAHAFLETCASRRVVFVGLSLTDANMRRWLSWVHDSRLDELRRIDSPAKSSTQHLWLNCAPNDPELRKWIEASVAHLGVRLVWLNGWDQVGLVLARMLNLPSS